MKNTLKILAFACLSFAGNWVHAQDSTVSVQLGVPDGGWKIRIDQVYQTPTHLLAVSKLERSPGPAIQVISQVKDSVKVKAPKLPVRHYVLGKTWNWSNGKPEVAGAKLIFQAKANPAPKVATMVTYIVVYKKDIFTKGKTKQGETLRAIAKRHCKELGASSPDMLEIINGFVAKFPAGNVPRLKALPEVKYIEMDQAF